MKIKSTYKENKYLDFPHCVNVFLLDEAAYPIYFVDNKSKVVDSTGYRPGYLIHPNIDKWLRKNIGIGQHGGPLPGETNYVNHLPGQKWWHGWSSDGKYHFINVHFTDKKDALIFRMIWA